MNRRKNSNHQKKRKQNRIVTVNPGRAFAPSRMRTTLTFSKAGFMTNLGANFVNVRFSPTALFDVDPILASTATPGFNEYAAIYRQYRVNSSRIRVGMANEESIGVTGYCVPVNFDPGANNATPYTYLSDRLAHTAIMARSQGDSKCSFTVKASTQYFAGVKYTGQEDNYSSAVTTSPVNNWWFMIGAVVNNGAFTTAGISFFVHIDITVEFYELNNPSG